MGGFAGSQLCETCEKAMIDAGVIGLIFEETIKPKEEFGFGAALIFLKEGFRVARKGWNGNGMFIYLVQGNEVPIEALRNEAFKHVAKNQTRDNVREIKINSHIDMKAADGSIVVGWLASQTDMLAEDWQIVG